MSSSDIEDKLSEILNNVNYEEGTSRLFIEQNQRLIKSCFYSGCFAITDRMQNKMKTCQNGGEFVKSFVDTVNEITDSFRSIANSPSPTHQTSETLQ